MYSYYRAKIWTYETIKYEQDPNAQRIGCIYKENVKVVVYVIILRW